MSAPVVLIGNDIHLPLNEMASWQVHTLRTHFALAPEQVVSLQSRKKILPESSETILNGNPGITSRIRQLFSLLAHLSHLPKNQSSILHYVGNGNQFLRMVLSIFARFTGRKLVLSTFGRVVRGPLPSHVHVIVPDKTCLPLKRSSNWHVVPPYSSGEAARPRDSSAGPILFSSVPPKASELAEREIPFLLRSFARLRRESPSAELLILNRYAWMESSLRIAAKEFAAEGVEVRTCLVNKMSDLLEHVSILVIPYAKNHLPQIPLSTVEALRAGVPCLVASGLALGEQLGEWKAGRCFGSESEFVAAVWEIQGNYRAYSEAALRFAGACFDAEVNLSAIGTIYSSLTHIEILPNDSSIAPTHETHRSNSMF